MYTSQLCTQLRAFSFVLGGILTVDSTPCKGEQEGYTLLIYKNNMKKALQKSLVAGSVFIASISLALAQVQVSIGASAQQGQVNGSALLQLLGLAQEIAGRLVPFAVTAAVLVFFYFLIMFIAKADSSDKRSDYLKGMGYSILALFVMVSIWGIIGLLGSILGVGQGGNIPIPGVPRPN